MAQAGEPSLQSPVSGAKVTSFQRRWVRDVILARLRRAEAPSWDWQQHRCCGDGASVPAPERGLEEKWSADLGEVPEARARPRGKLCARVPWQPGRSRSVRTGDPRNPQR